MRGKPFEAYYSIKPRFVSEFGYQSFPALSTIETYCPDSQLNLTSPVMEHHQKNPSGNSIIIGNFTRYFRMPSGLGNMVYLSQCQQALAMKMACEYFRSLRPHCMGSLIWQLDDDWPVASWSSIDYTGKWKALHYAMRRFYAPVTPIAIRRDDGSVDVFVSNDTQQKLSQAKDRSKMRFVWRGKTVCKSVHAGYPSRVIHPCLHVAFVSFGFRQDRSVPVCETEVQ
jgi:beta-mannosidase